MSDENKVQVHVQTTKPEPKASPSPYSCDRLPTGLFVRLSDGSDVPVDLGLLGESSEGSMSWKANTKVSLGSGVAVQLGINMTVINTKSAKDDAKHPKRSSLIREAVRKATDAFRKAKA